MRSLIPKFLLLMGFVCPLALATATNGIKTPTAIEEIVSLPISGVQAVQSDGKIVYLSENGRFVFTGQIYDLWSKQPLTTMEKIKEVTERIYLKGMGIEVDNLNTLSLGSGKKEVIVFVDPRCGYCHTLMKEAKQYQNDYTFKFVVVPILGAESYKQARSIYCTDDKAAALNALIEKTVHALQVNPKCNTAQYDLSLRIPGYVGIESVPFVVAPDGRVKQGYPKNLKLWLEN